MGAQTVRHPANQCGILRPGITWMQLCKGDDLVGNGGMNEKFPSDSSVAGIFHVSRSLTCLRVGLRTW